MEICEMDYERMLFEKGCFLGCWNDDIVPEQPKSSVQKIHQDKDLDTLLEELAQIKQHIENVRQRKWELEKSLIYHYNNFISE